jgi:hypothetical protein
VSNIPFFFVVKFRETDLDSVAGKNSKVSSSRLKYPTQEC